MVYTFDYDYTKEENGKENLYICMVKISLTLEQEIRLKESYQSKKYDFVDEDENLEDITELVLGEFAYIAEGAEIEFDPTVLISYPEELEPDYLSKVPNAEKIQEYNETIFEYRDDIRRVNRHAMENTVEWCQNAPTLMESIKESIQKQQIIREDEDLQIPEDGPSESLRLNLERTMHAADIYRNRYQPEFGKKKVAVLNFANYYHVGGSPYYANAQEESNCRCSTLYPCLRAVEKEYHFLHTQMREQQQLNQFGGDDIIYTPGVTVFKSDEPIPRILHPNDWYQVDVITAAAPNLKESFDEKELEEVLRRRITRIVQIAKQENVDTLILGAFGCGAFHNPPEIVARVFKEVLQQYHLNQVVFSIYTPSTEENDNLRVFANTIWG